MQEVLGVYETCTFVKSSSKDEKLRLSVFVEVLVLERIPVFLKQPAELRLP
jgi:hypothetical protein